MRKSVATALIAVAAVVAASPLLAGGREAPRAKSRFNGERVPVKDCTRFNGRYGYYANPWCNVAEQDAFDRAEARRLGRAR